MEVRRDTQKQIERDKTQQYDYLGNGGNKEKKTKFKGYEDDFKEANRNKMDHGARRNKEGFQRIRENKGGFERPRRDNEDFQRARDNEGFLRERENNDFQRARENNEEFYRERGNNEELQRAI